MRMALKPVQFQVVAVAKVINVSLSVESIGMEPHEHRFLLCAAACELYSF